jgi:hypothetical protein
VDENQRATSRGDAVGYVRGFFNCAINARRLFA